MRPPFLPSDNAPPTPKPTLKGPLPQGLGHILNALIKAGLTHSEGTNTPLIAPAKETEGPPPVEGMGGMGDLGLGGGGGG